ncbi:motility associated factor glycosyltransferase family protein [Aeribacillus alveayuensis]|uniref:DUF115 domain-containing protein n=1 Tax=Aeribacillus alveayuensis TaxID=279215 RepID=A0ABT9VLT3_9BACI|nr:hypothetical protein [Bacillus alveayuensis]
MNYEQLNWSIIRLKKDVHIDDFFDNHVEQFEFFQSKTGHLTCLYEQNDGEKYLIHSKYAPIKEASRMVQSQLKGYDFFERVIVYGFGCGHHIRELQKVVDDNVEIEVWETNITFFYEVLKYDDFTSIFKDKRLKIKITQQINKFFSEFECLEHNKVAFIVHQPSLRLIPKFLHSFQLALEKFMVKITTISNFSHVLKNNFLSNISLQNPSIAPFIQQFENDPIIMVSAGPSLEKNIHMLHEAKKHSLICCVGTALKPLLNFGIYPDFFMMIDPKDQVFEQIEDLCDLNIPLFYLSTVNRNVPLKYKGSKFIVYQEGYPLAEEYAYREGIPIIQSGGSVATALFDLLLKFGFSSICLVGQDLAYTNHQTHIIDTHNFKQFASLSDDVIYIPSFDQLDKVPTSKQFLIYRDWFTNIARLENRSLYNATEGGAYIDGFEHITLFEFIEKNKEIDISATRKYFKSLVQLHVNMGRM